MWHDGKMHGIGKSITPDGGARTGEWAQGKRVRWLDPAPPGTETMKELVLVSSPDKKVNKVAEKKEKEKEKEKAKAKDK